MNRTRIAIAAAALLVLGAGISPALEGGDADAPKTEILEGSVVSVDASARSLTVSAEDLAEDPDGAGAEIVIRVDEGTQIVSDGREIDLSEIETGDGIVANCVIREDGSYVALSIGVSQVSEAPTARL